MSRKTQTSYEDVFKFVDDNVFPINTSNSFTTDYELAMRNALKKLFPGADMIACYFHYTQALNRKASQLRGVMDEINKDALAKSIYQRTMCLPLLPADRILAAFKDLVSEVKNLEDPVAFKPFLEYVHAQWMQKVRRNMN